MESKYPVKEIAEAKVTGYPSFVTLAALRAAGITETTKEKATEITKEYVKREVKK